MGRPSPHSEHVRRCVLNAVRDGVAPKRAGEAYNVPHGTVLYWLTEAGLSAREIAQANEMAACSEGMTVTECAEAFSEMLGGKALCEYQRVRFNPAIERGHLRPGESLYVRLSNAQLVAMGDRPIRLPRARVRWQLFG